MDTDAKPSVAAVDRAQEIACTGCQALLDVSDLEPFTHMECPHCGHVATVPGRLGGFLLLDVIGIGGMGGVYLARDESLGRLVAVKIMLPSLGEDAEFVENFKREAQAAARLNHPHIAQIYSFGQAKGQPYIVMELVAGHGLDKLIDQGKPLDPAMVMRVGLGIAEGLREADAIGLIHGDIKPENILLDEKMNGKLVDFGIATYANQAGSQGIWGTPYYIAPEKVLRQNVDARSDIYCLGATLYHALSGKPPFEGDTPVDVVKARIDNQPPPLRSVREDINERVEKIISRMLQPDPAQRYPTYASLISDLRKSVKELDADAHHKAGSRVSRKIVIRKTAGKQLITGGAGGASPGRWTHRRDAGTADGGEDGKDTPEAKKEKKEKPPRRERTPEEKANLRKAIVILVVIVASVLLLLGAAGAGVYLKFRRDRTMAERREFLALNTARRQVDKAYADIRLAVTNILTYVARTDGYATRVTNAVTLVTGNPADDLLAILAPPPEPEPEPEPEAGLEGTNTLSLATNAVPGTGASPTNAPAATTNAPQPEAGVDADEPGPAPDPDPDAQPEPDTEPGVDPLADPVPGAEGEAAEPQDEPAEPEPVGEPEPPPPDEPPIRRLARKALEALAVILSHERTTRDIADTAATVHAEGMNAWHSSLAATKAAALTELLDRLGHIERNVKDAVVAADEAVAEAVKLADDLLEQRRLDEEAQARATREREEQLRQEREREAYEAQKLADLAAVEVLRAEFSMDIKLHRYEDAARAAARRADDFQTAEGKAALQVVVDRYRHLANLKTFIVEQLAKGPVGWGWVQGRSAEDVLGATARHVQLRGRLVPWREVSTRQMLHFIRHYVSPSNQSVKMRPLAEYSLAAAVFCFENGGMQAAATFAEQATRLSPRIEDDIKRLIPFGQDDGNAEQEAPPPPPPPPTEATPPPTPPLSEMGF